MPLYLLVSDSRNRKVRIPGDSRNQISKLPCPNYSREESLYKDNSDVQVVLVSVTSVDDLKESYPSYFLDSTNFITQVRELFIKT